MSTEQGALRAACLALCTPHWPQAGPAHPCQPPHLSTAALSLMGRARHPHGGTSSLLPDDSSPYSHTLPPSLDSPRSQLQSWHAKLCQGGRCGGVHSPTQLLAQGVLPVPRQHKTRAREPLGEQDEGPSCSNPRQQRLCPASRSRAWSPSWARQRSALGMGQFWVQPAWSLARGGDPYRVRMATGYSKDMCSAPLMGSLRLA